MTPAPLKPASPEELHARWASEGTPEALSAAVDSLKPVIERELAAQGASGDTLARHQARVYAGGAVRSYDPSAGAGLGTWTQRSQQQLRRFRRMNSRPVPVPDRAVLDNWSLHVAERNFIDEHDREPDIHELADAAGMPVRRIEKVRATMRSVGAEREGADPEMAGAAGTFDLDYSKDAMDYVYGDADKVDRMLLEARANYGGKHAQPVPLAELAAKARLDPATLSRRAQALALRILQTQRDLESDD